MLLLFRLSLFYHLLLFSLSLSRPAFLSSFLDCAITLVVVIVLCLSYLPFFNHLLSFSPFLTLHPIFFYFFSSLTILVFFVSLYRVFGYFRNFCIFGYFRTFLVAYWLFQKHFGWFMFFFSFFFFTILVATYYFRNFLGLSGKRKKRNTKERVNECGEGGHVIA